MAVNYNVQNIIVDNLTVSREIVDPQTAFIMKDML